MKKLTVRKVKKWVKAHQRLVMVVGVVLAGLIIAGVVIKNSAWYRQKVLHSRLQRNAKSAADIPYLRGIRRGEWQGMLPCADCEGIETNIRLYTKKAGEALGTYQFIQNYQGNETGVLLSEGKWTMAIEEKEGMGEAVSGEYIVFIPGDESGEMYAVLGKDGGMEMLNSERVMLGEGYRLSEVVATF